MKERIKLPNKPPKNLALLIFGSFLFIFTLLLVAPSNNLNNLPATVSGNIITNTPESINADVVVVGSSLAGWSASVSAAREGASVILISETNCIGGQATCAGVSTWDGPWIPGAGGPWGIDKALRDSIEQQYRDANVRLGGCYSSVPNSNTSGEKFIEGDNFCPHPMRLEDFLKLTLNLNGVSVLYTNVNNINTNGVINTDAGDYVGKVVIEATENGELIPSNLRRPVDSLCKQHKTWVAGIRNGGSGPKLSSLSYNTDPEYMERLEDWWNSNQYHWANLTGKDGFPVYRRTHDLNGELVIYLNWMNDAETADESKDLTMQMLVFLADKGYGDWTYVIQEIPYTRTSDYRLNGQTNLGETPRGVDSFSDSVSVGGYRADYHGDACPELEAAEPYGIYDVPAGIGIPEERVPILVAMPRSGDVSDLRATSLRMQPDEIGFGEAMGIMAAVSAEKNTLPHDVDINVVRELLVQYGARVDV